MNYELKTHYEGADLFLQFGAKPKASLQINGVERETLTAGQALATLKLTSVVQTGYEYHEHIEATVSYAADTIDASIRAGEKELISTSINRAD